MKLTWGHWITAAIIAFMSFIIYIVVQTFQLNADLVQDDFYEQEIRFNDKKKMIHNYKNLGQTIAVTATESGVEIVFPETLKNASGLIQFYRPDDKKLDREFDIELMADRTQILEYKNFREGKYEVNIEFTANTTPYLHQSSILF